MPELKVRGPHDEEDEMGLCFSAIRNECSIYMEERKGRGRETRLKAGKDKRKKWESERSGREVRRAEGRRDKRKEEGRLVDT